MTEHKHDLKTTLLFFQIGFFNSFQSGVVLAATQDILGGSSIPSTVNLVLISVPNLLAKFTVPWVIYRVSYLSSWVVIVLVTMLSMVFVAMNVLPVRMVGVALAGLSVGLTVIVSMAMMAKYPRLDVLISANRTGLGLGDIFSSLGYTGLTTWTCVAPRTTIVASIPFCFAPLLFYCLLDKGPLEVTTRKPPVDPRAHVKYTPVENPQHSSALQSKAAQTIRMLWTIAPLAGYLYLSKMSRDICLNAILTTIAFPSSPFLPRDHYQYYMLIFTFARLLGGTGPMIAARAGSDWQEFSKIRKIWMLAILDVVPIFLYVMVSWYRFISDVRIIFAVCFVHGLISGMLAVYTVIYTADQFGASEEKGVAMGVVEASSPAGVLVAGTIGAVIEPILKQHCTVDLHLGEFCSTRFTSAKAWTQNLHCK